jgi:hypothetical protein
MFTFICLSGCTSVNIIQPVAQQNMRNAEALNSNIKVFLDGDELFFKSTLDAYLIDEYRAILKSIQDKDKPTDSSDVRNTEIYYKTEAKKLVDAVSGLSEEAKKIEIARYDSEKPLSAAVAFHNVSPNTAAKEWIDFETIYKSKASKETKFDLYVRQFKSLPIFEQKEQATKDLLQAYTERKQIVLQQSLISKEIASQLLSASVAGYDANKFLTGVNENNQIVKSIAEYVYEKTGKSDRKIAAEELLKSLASKTDK